MNASTYTETHEETVTIHNKLLAERERLMNELWEVQKELKESTRQLADIPHTQHADGTVSL